MSELSDLIPNNINFNQKYNVADLNSVTSSNVISTTDINTILSGISECINYISALTNTDQFDQFWSDMENYISNLLDTSYPGVKSFNNLTGHVWGISAVTLNNKTYYPTKQNNYSLTEFPYILSINQTTNSKQFVSRFNNKNGNILGVSRVLLNNKNYYYNPLNRGIIHFEDLKNKDTLSSIVIQYNNLTGDVYGLEGININNTTYNSPIIKLYDPISTYLEIKYFDNYAVSANQYFNGIITLDTPSENDQDNSIINKQFIDKYTKNLLFFKTINLSKFCISNNTFYIDKSTLIINTASYDFVTILNVKVHETNTKTIIYNLNYLKEDSTYIYFSLSETFPSLYLNDAIVQYLLREI